MFHAVLAVSSCCSNVVLLEAIIRGIPGSAHVMTFFQFLFIAAAEFIFTSKFGTAKRAIPIRAIIWMVVLFFASNFTNNFALNFDIAMPLHMIFKSGSLVANMLLNMLILNKRYTFQKYVSVFLVTAGIFLFTWASEKNRVQENHEKPSSLIGILLLLVSLVTSASLGIYQETLFKRYGKHPREVLFYMHTLSLPVFLFVLKDVHLMIPLFSKSDPVNVFSTFTLPSSWLYILGNVLTQYLCIRSVFSMAAIYSSLTCTMILTFRKFLSLMLSVLYFQNIFTVHHWLGTFFVFIGSLLFVCVDKMKIKTL